MKSLLLIAFLFQGPKNLQVAEDAKVEPPVVVPAGTTFPISLVTQISTKDAKPGDGVYGRTVYPITAGDKIVVPEGSYVKGKIVDSELPGRVKGKASLTISFQTLTLPSGISIPIYASLGSVGGSATRRGETSVEGDSSKGKDGKVIAQTGSTGAVLGGLAGRGKGVLTGGAIGAGVGLAGVLLSRGEHLVLKPGTTMELVLDRPIEP